MGYKYVTGEEAAKLRQRVYELYGRQHLYDQRNVLVDSQRPLKILRHEDSIPGWSGTWVDIAVFIPDPDGEEVR